VSVRSSTKKRTRTTRPAARRGRRTRNNLSIAARVVCIVALLVGGVLLFNKIKRPIVLLHNERRERDRIVAEYNTLRDENEKLRRQLAYIRTSRGIAQAARKQGFVKPGEISLVIPEEPAASRK
jgi:cell division protein FtsB